MGLMFMTEICRPWIGLGRIPAVRRGLLHIGAFLGRERRSSGLSFWLPNLEVQQPWARPGSSRGGYHLPLIFGSKGDTLVKHFMFWHNHQQL